MSELLPSHVWYIQAGSLDAQGDFVREAQATGVLVLLREKATGRPFKALLTVQHLLRLNPDQRTGAYRTHFRVWRPNTGFTGRTSMKAEPLASLTPPLREKMAEREDFAFLQLDEGTGVAAARLANRGQPGAREELVVVGFDGGEKGIRALADIVKAQSHPGCVWTDRDEHRSMEVLRPGTGSPMSGASGGGVFRDGYLLGIYRGKFDWSNSHLFLPIDALQRWCGPLGYELVSDSGAAPVPDPRRQALEDALLECSFVQNAEQFARLVEGFERDVILQAAASTWERASRLAGFAPDDRGGVFSRLLDRVRRFGFDPPAARLYTALDAYCRRVVSWRELADVKDTLQEKKAFDLIGQDILDRLLRTATEAWDGVTLARHSPMPEGFDRRLSLCLDQLADAPRPEAPDAVIPLVTFLHLCRRDLKLTDTALRALAKRNGWNLPAPSTPPRLLTLPHSALENALQIFFEPKLPGRPSVFLLRSYLEESGHVTPFPSADVVESGMDALPTHVEALIGRALAKGSSKGKTIGRIELFLPLQSLVIPLEQTVNALAGITTMRLIGKMWPVTVRSQERRDPNVNARLAARQEIWRAKWQGVQRKVPSGKQVPWACDSRPDSQSYDDYFSQVPLHGFKILWTPAPGRAAEEIEAFGDAVLIGGLPLGIWVREPRGDLAYVRARVNALLRSLRADQWPERIRQYREGNRPPMIDCDGLTLFYDQPDWKDPHSHAQFECP